MPKDDTVQPVTSGQQPTTSMPPIPTVSEDTVLPPKFPDLPTKDAPQPVVDSSSTAPSDDIITPMATTPIAPITKKASTKGRVIATILGLFLLVGGIGAGVLLVGQEQNISEKAAEGQCGDQQTSGDCTSTCSPNGYKCKWSTLRQHCSEGATLCSGSGGGGTCTPATCPECNGGSYPSRCTFLGGKECQKENGFNTGYECTCTDLSAGGCWQYQWSCGTVNTNACPVEGNSPPPASFCSATTCSNLVNTACWVNHYRSNDNDDPTVNDIVIAEHASSATLGATNCGAEQIDVGCPGVNLADTISRRYANDCGTSTTPPTNPTPTPTPITAQCQNVKAYSETWTLLTSAQLAALRPTNKVNFCVTGVTTGGSFDKARFTINNVLQAETTTIRPTSTDFCQLYTIPTGTNTFNVSAEIHHVTLGWK